MSGRVARRGERWWGFLASTRAGAAWNRGPALRPVPKVPQNHLVDALLHPGQLRIARGEAEDLLELVGGEVVVARQQEDGQRSFGAEALGLILGLQDCGEQGVVLGVASPLLAMAIGILVPSMKSGRRRACSSIIGSPRARTHTSLLVEGVRLMSGNWWGIPSGGVWHAARLKHQDNSLARWERPRLLHQLPNMSRESFRLLATLAGCGQRAPWPSGVGCPHGTGRVSSGRRCCCARR